MIFQVTHIAENLIEGGTLTRSYALMELGGGMFADELGNIFQATDLAHPDRLGRGFSLRRLGDPFPPRSCRSCGCTDEDCSGCIERTGYPCRWVQEDLCSACVPAEVLEPGKRVA